MHQRNDHRPETTRTHQSCRRNEWERGRSARLVLVLVLVDADGSIVISIVVVIVIVRTSHEHVVAWPREAIHGNVVLARPIMQSLAGATYLYHILLANPLGPLRPIYSVANRDPSCLASDDFGINMPASRL